jgi:hypothetical protein
VLKTKNLVENVIIKDRGELAHRIVFGTLHGISPLPFMIAQGPTRIISLIHQRFLATGNF